MSRIVVLATLAAACTTQPEEVDRHACGDLREHVVDLRLSGGPGDENRMPDYEAHKTALTRALGERYLTSCVANFNADQVRCAKSATDEVAAALCLAAGTK